MDPIQVKVEVVEEVQVEVEVVEEVQVDIVQVDDAVPGEDAIPAQPVTTRKRTRKYLERITKIRLMRKIMKKEGSTNHHLLVLE